LARVVRGVESAVSLLDLNIASSEANFRRAGCKNLILSIYISVAKPQNKRPLCAHSTELSADTRPGLSLRLRAGWQSAAFSRPGTPYDLPDTLFMRHIYFYEGSRGGGGRRWRLSPQPLSLVLFRFERPPVQTSPLGAPDPALRCPRPPQRSECYGYGHAPGWPGPCASGPWVSSRAFLEGRSRPQPEYLIKSKIITMTYT